MYPPYAIVGGVPARIIKYRASKDVINRMEEISWWDWPADRIAAHSDILHLPIEQFVAEYDRITKGEMHI